MGLFRRALDYSSGNGSLPKISLSSYQVLVPPSSRVLNVPDIQLMQLEQRAKKGDAFITKALEIYEDSNRDWEITSVVEQYLGWLWKHVAPSLESEAVQTVGKFMALGCAMAIAEQESGLAIENRVHPSVRNAQFQITSQRDPSLHQIFQNHPSFRHLLTVSIEVGYFCFRTSCAVTTEQLATEIRPEHFNSN